MQPVDRYAAALRQTLRATSALGARLTDGDWRRPTECPLWTVGDIYAHLAAVEGWMAAGHLPLETDDFQSWLDADVAARRSEPREAVLAELAEVCRIREKQLDDLPDPDSPAVHIWGEPTTFLGLLAVRVLDCWVHEQDIRRAVGQPGGLGSPGARVARDGFVEALPRIVARRVKAPPGSTIRLTVVGEVGLDVAVEMNGSGRGKLISARQVDRPTAHVTIEWESYARLSCGRGLRSEHHAWLAGDRGLAEKLLDHLAITP